MRMVESFQRSVLSQEQGVRGKDLLDMASQNSLSEEEVQALNDRAEEAAQGGADFDCDMRGNARDRGDGQDDDNGTNREDENDPTLPSGEGVRQVTTTTPTTSVTSMRGPCWLKARSPLRRKIMRG